jgi:hypothetical protein
LFLNGRLRDFRSGLFLHNARLGELSQSDVIHPFRFRLLICGKNKENPRNPTMQAEGKKQSQTTNGSHR